MLPEPDAARLADYRFQMGHDAGNLALTLDQLTDVMQLIARHAVYCRVEKGPRAGEPPLDVAELLRLLAATKELVQESLLRLRAA
ncbi:MAG TPA: hypothetical protein VFG68_19195 [Fimbriiglobus sp.]|nr:hypothetical protein [Fimbriiglobus sp.]